MTTMTASIINDDDQTYEGKSIILAISDSETVNSVTENYFPFS